MSPVNSRLPLDRLLLRLSSPIKRHLLDGRSGSLHSLPGHIVCFRRTSIAHLSPKDQGRFLHHRFVLVFNLRTAMTVSVDERVIRLSPGHGLLILPFQFHHWIVNPAHRSLRWLFITFELDEAGPLESLRFRPFLISSAMRHYAAELIQAYLDPRQANTTVLLMSLLLTRIMEAKSLHSKSEHPLGSKLMLQVNQFAQRKPGPVKVKEMAASLGISVSHLQNQFHISSGGLSLARHLRRLRLEKACGLLRLGSHRITEISELCGFSSIYAFSRAFRHTYGVSPLAYRKRSGSHNANG